MYHVLINKRYYEKAINFTLAFFLISSPIFAAPSINAINGAITDDSIVTITSSSATFGSGPSNVEWLGGKTGAIESGINNSNFAKTNWIQDGNNPWPENFPKYSTSRAHSGSKSIYCNPNSSSWNSVLVYKLPTPISSTGSLFISQWVYITLSGSAGQWKMNRYNDYNSIVDNETPGLVVFAWNNVVQICQDTYNMSYSTMNYDVNPITTQGVWMRIDQWIVCSSSNSGSYTMTKYVPGVSREVGTLSNYKTFGRSTAWNYIIWQNFVGNGYTSANIYFDDIYISAGSQARVELGDAPTYTSCTHVEIQPVLSWSNSSIVFKVNKGSFASGSAAYLFVIDSNGNASVGYPITIGSDSSGGVISDTTKPATPTGVSVQLIN